MGILENVKGIVRKPVADYEEKGEVTITSGLMKEIPLFKYELAFYLLISFSAFMMFFLNKVGLMEQGDIYAMLLLVGFVWGFWFIKRILYMPTGNKIFIEKALEGGGIKVIIANPPKDNAIHYAPKSRELDNPPTHIERYNKHYEFFTGKPWVKCAQGQEMNYSVSELYEGKTDKTGQEVEALLQKYFDAGWLAAMSVATRMQSMLKNPLTILTLATIAMVFITLLIVAMQFNMLNQTLELTALMAKKMGVELPKAQGLLSGLI